METQQTPETIALAKEKSKLFWREVWTMPPHLRRIITHIYVCGRSQEETAALLGISATAVNLLHTKALDSLKVGISSWLLQ